MFVGAERKVIALTSVSDGIACRICKGRLQYRKSGEWFRDVLTRSEADAEIARLQEEDALFAKCRADALAAQQARQEAERERREAERERWRGLSLQARLTEINGRRRTRCLSWWQVRDAIEKVASWPASRIGCGVLLRPHGLVGSPKAYRKLAFRGGESTLCVVARVRGGVAVDVARGDECGSLYSVWRATSLRDTDVNGTPSPRLVAWARDESRIRLSLRAASRLQPILLRSN